MFEKVDPYILSIKKSVTIGSELANTKLFSWSLAKHAFVISD